jgi:hypothetical protein
VLVGAGMKRDVGGGDGLKWSGIVATVVNFVQQKYKEIVIIK